MKQRFPKLTRTFLLILCGAEFFLVGYVWKKTEPTSIKAALAKEGSQYILRWENSDHTIETKVFSSPVVAFEFAKNDLSLRPGVNPHFDDALENVWVRREMGKHVIFWKTGGFNRVHRLTFKEESHAALFEQAFRQGAYSPSPLGHAIYFVKLATP